MSDWSVFQLAPSPTAAEVVKLLPHKMPDCAFCGHPEKMHCKGGVSHISYKDEARMNRAAKKSICTSRHCESPICCCTFYQEPK